MSGERTFVRARRAALKSLQSIHQGLKEDGGSNQSYEKNWSHILIFSSIPLSSAVIFMLCGILQGLAAPVLVGFILLWICAGNVIVILRSSKEEHQELTKEIKAITDSFQRSLDEPTITSAGNINDKRKGSSNSNVNNTRGSDDIEKILTGNPHISVVTCYRNQEWQRLPSLLLVEGDVIALMAGDITPCKMYELSPIRTNTNNVTRSSSSSSSAPTASRQHDIISLGNSLWQKGSSVQSGAKIHLRKNASKWTEEQENEGQGQQRKPPTSPFKRKQKRSYERHRSVPSKSTELLALSGDVRCFIVAENPIEKFGNKLMLESTIPRFSLLSSVCRALGGTAVHVQEGKHGEESYIRKLFVTTVKEMIYLMFWLLIAFLILSLAKSIFLGTIDRWCTAIAIPAAVVPLSFSFIALPSGMLLVESIALSNILSKAEALLQEEAFDVSSNGIVNDANKAFTSFRQHFKSGGSSSSHDDNREMDKKDGDITNINSDKSSSNGDFDDDDEDLDKRALENSEEASHRIQFRRQLKYALHILCSRLGLLEKWRKDTNDLLPIPMSKLRLLEVLGSVTMVCFVDDDIICEDFSVTEEIFLLQSTGNSEVKTKVLDLHANPDAKGSRFENPQWFTHLPSLKPIGLNAVLTYSPFPPIKKMADYLRDGNLFEFEGQNFTMDEKFGMSSSSSLVAGKSVGNLGVSKATAWTSLKDYGSINKSKSKNKNRKNEVEVALVDHVRKCMPLRTLKELAEEIGFVKEDYMSYTRVLEMNVIAPRLCDLKMMEDTHAWGQEETRRRGTLATQVRGVLVKDTRGGGLQMMSQGDPSLILNYSKEYWDGINITPLTIADRTEVLKVYDRWDLEDYDVVGLSYTPAPFYLQATIMDAYGDSAIRLDSKGNEGAAGGKHQRSTDTYFSSQENCLFFVDPRSERDLLPKYKEKSTTNDENSNVKHDGGSSGVIDAADGMIAGRSRSRSRLDSDQSTYSNASQRSPRRGSNTSVSAKSSPSRASFDSGSMMPVELQKSTSENDLYILGQRDEVNYIRDSYSSGDLKNLMASAEDSRKEKVDEEEEEDGHGSGEGSEEGEILADEEVDEEVDVPVDDVDILFAGDDEVQTNVSNVDSTDQLNLQENCSDLMSQIESNKDAVLELEILGREVRSESDPILSSPPAQHASPSSPGPKPSFDRSPIHRESFSSSNASRSSRSRRLSQDLVDEDGSDNDHDILLQTVTGNVSWIEDDDSAIEMSHQGSADTLLSPKIPSLSLKRSVSLDGAFALKSDLTDEYKKIVTDDNDLPSEQFQKDEKTIDLVVNDNILVPVETPLSLADVNESINRVQSSKNLSTSYAREGSIQTSAMNTKKSLAASLWPLMRHQVFLGMIASSVPVKPEAPELVEDLTSAGIRFVYFSPRNMRRSKPLANKLGLETDWNCAISLRPLDGKAHDPHRMTSTNYTDWDVMAQMPHGIEAIKRHLYEVDNVPLLVSLYTDATADTVKQMVNVFRGFGETVMTIGSGYRETNRDVFCDSDAAMSVSMLPGNAVQIPLQARALLEKFPLDSSVEGLCQSDVNLVLSLIGIGTLPFLQLPSSYSDGQEISMDEDDEELPTQVRLSTMLESIRDGRIILLNMFQMIGMIALSSVSLAMWQLVALAIPVKNSPTLPPILALLFVMVYIPCITISMLFSPSNDFVMKNTPRKNSLDVRPRDRERFVFILCARVFLILFSTFAVGWVCAVDTIKGNQLNSEYFFAQFHDVENVNSGSIFVLNGEMEHVQDVVSFMILLAMIFQASSSLYRGQKMVDFPSPYSCPMFYLMSIFSLLIHTVVLLTRASLREMGIDRYRNMSIIVYILMPTLAFFCSLLAYPFNEYDNNHYRRYLNFLRLEFDTRLGMHSPR